MAIDWRNVALWRDLLLRDELPKLVRALEARGTRAVAFTWDPPAAAIAAPQNRFLLDYWRGQAAGGLPPIAIADPSRMRPALGYIAVAEPAGDGRDVSYRLFGSTLVAVSGVDMTRKLLSEHPSPTATVVEAGLAVYQAVRERRLPLLWGSEPQNAEYIARWERLVLPLAGPDGAVGRFIAGNAPFDSRGRVLVM